MLGTYFCITDTVVNHKLLNVSSNTHRDREVGLVARKYVGRGRDERESEVKDDHQASHLDV